MEVVNLIQGTQEWLDFRKEHYPASNAPAVMSDGKYEPKTPESLALERLGIKTREIDDFTQSIFKEGHDMEEAARPLVEKHLLGGQPLANLTVRKEVEGLPLSASLDGIDFTGKTLFEHKKWNEGLAEEISSGELSPYYYWQLEQQLLVSGGSQVIFVTSDSFELEEIDLAQFEAELVVVSDKQVRPDGTKFYYAARNFAYLEYTSRPERVSALLDGWKRYAQIEAKTLQMQVNEDWELEANEFVALQVQIDELSEQLKALTKQQKPHKEAIKDMLVSSGQERLLAAGVEAFMSHRKGGLDEKLLAKKLTKEDIEACRKPESTSYYVKRVA